jgi:hypothetical protein
MIQQSTKYKIHVEGQIEGQGPEEFIHTYDYDNVIPPTEEEAKKIAGDFLTIHKLVVEEVTTVVKKRIIKL